MLDVVLEKNRLYPSFANPAATGKPELEKLANFLITDYINQGKTGRCWGRIQSSPPFAFTGLHVEVSHCPDGCLMHART
ncbi:hypothetical protein AS888_08335 [Peribacillus simplex]|uniref:Uncharacterized protein n=2 Tax=Peribacillus simplex TaxID=1478 RepID=A0A125QRC3_9BACI|nr:hypothetical protein AS888_08335 [Peribacillus simplex]